jgi:hypothetical protein
MAGTTADQPTRDPSAHLGVPTSMQGWNTPATNAWIAAWTSAWTTAWTTAWNSAWNAAWHAATTAHGSQTPAAGHAAPVAGGHATQHHGHAPTGIGAGPHHTHLYSTFTPAHTTPHTTSHAAHPTPHAATDHATAHPSAADQHWQPQTNPFGWDDKTHSPATTPTNPNPVPHRPQDATGEPPQQGVRARPAA